MTELLIEIFSEEIPARMQKKAADDFAGLIQKGLKEAGLSFDKITPHVSPRRLVCVVDGMDEVRPDVRDERRGPKTSAPEQAVQGFLRGAGLDSLDQCEKRELPKGEFWFAIIEKKGGPTIDVLPSIIDKAIHNLPWPKSMRWGKSTFRWVRPMHRITALFGGQQIDGTLKTGDRDIAYANETEGHRFLNRGPFTIENFAQYEQQLRAHNVILDREERKSIIMEGANKLAAERGVNLLEDKWLLEEVAGLVEWPVVLCGQFDKDFLEVPKEVLTASMKEHQKYFSVLDKNGKLANRFIMVANKPDDEGIIVAGNEKVLRARLADAKFFWDQDLKLKLEDRLPKLEAITFHEKLGTLTQKVKRMTALASSLALTTGAEEEDAERAAYLCKADLVSEMVNEFSEVQGLMGCEYALKQGEKENVALAIAEHYSPAGPSDACPTSPVSVALALADKIDTLVGFFAVGLKPTGSKDPFALRRSALAIIRLILENNLKINLRVILEAAAQQHGLKADIDEILSFIDDRLKVALKDKGNRFDMIEAVFARTAGSVDITQKVIRLEAVREFLETEDGGQLIAAYRRGANIVKAEEKKSGQSITGNAKETLLSELQEEKLFQALSKTRLDIQPALESGNYQDAMKAMSTLRAPLDDFFENVTVNDNTPEIRTNRLHLLSEIRTVMDQVADFSKIEG